MTLLNAIVGTDGRFAVLSCDSAAGRGGYDWRAPGDGKPPNAAPLFFMSKLFAYPHIPAVLGLAGALPPAAECLGLLLATGGQIPDVRALLPLMPGELGKIAKKHQGQEFAVVLAGWAAGRVHARLYFSWADFAEEDLEGRYYSNGWSDTGGARLRGGFDRAPRGTPSEAAAFSRELLTAQLDSYRAGRFPPGFVAAGPFIVLTIDSLGIAIKTCGEAEIAPA